MSFLFALNSLILTLVPSRPFERSVDSDVRIQRCWVNSCECDGENRPALPPKIGEIKQSLKIVFPEMDDSFLENVAASARDKEHAFDLVLAESTAFSKSTPAAGSASKQSSTKKPAKAQWISTRKDSVNFKPARKNSTSKQPKKESKRRRVQQPSSESEQSSASDGEFSDDDYVSFSNLGESDRDQAVKWFDTCLVEELSGMKGCGATKAAAIIKVRDASDVR